MLAAAASRIGAGQRMLRVPFQARGELQHQFVVHARRGEPFGQRRLAVGQRAGLVEDDRAAAVDALEHGGILE